MAGAETQSECIICFDKYLPLDVRGEEGGRGGGGDWWEIGCKGWGRRNVKGWVGLSRWVSGGMGWCGGGGGREDEWWVWSKYV